MISITRTGSFPIGFRRGGGWQTDLGKVIAFATESRFAAVDVGPLDEPDLKKITAAKLTLGTVDLKDWRALASPDPAKRHAAVQANVDYVRMAVKLGARNFFTVVLPENDALPRKENFAFAVDGYSKLASEIANLGARIVIEGWPGPAPLLPALACTPADYRAFLKEMPANVGVNFDPSHLIRMGCDPVPFLREFAPRVYHVHGKDTELSPEAQQDHGTEQPATFADRHRWGAWHWRYTIPGHGCARWTTYFRILADARYAGLVCIELEDENFADTEENTKLGYLAGRDFLRYA